MSGAGLATIRRPLANGIHVGPLPLHAYGPIYVMLVAAVTLRAGTAEHLQPRGSSRATAPGTRPLASSTKRWPTDPSPRALLAGATWFARTQCGAPTFGAEVYGGWCRRQGAARSTR